MVKLRVKQGWLQGEELETSTGNVKYCSFKGIPFATPPLGDLRFKTPLPMQPWKGVRNATEHGHMCPQRDIFTGEIIPGSEDCLHLNVYSPNCCTDSKLTVMVFIHGGGYKSGSGNIHHYGPDFLVQYGVVVVTINYRVETFGFLCLDTEDVPGNAGLKDQVLALQWVQDNISVFGGDPEKVTVFGESAGGASAILHTLSPMSKGLMKRVIAMSGVPTCNWGVPFEPKRRAFVLGKQRGFNTNNPSQLLKFLQSVPKDELIDSGPCVLTSELIIQDNTIQMYHFTPVSEKNCGQNHFLTERPLDILRSGKMHEVDVMIGYTSKETLLGVDWFKNKYLAEYDQYPELSVPRKILLECPPRKILQISDRIKAHYFGNNSITMKTLREFVEYSSHSAFNFDIQNWLQSIPRQKRRKRFLYRFSAVSKLNIYGNKGAEYDIFGASHLDDLMYLFNAKHANLKFSEDSIEAKMINLTCTLFTNFAKYGTPTPDDSLGSTWPEYDRKKYYGDISDTLTIGKDLDADAVSFWKSIYEDAGVD